VVAGCFLLGARTGLPHRRDDPRLRPWLVVAGAAAVRGRPAQPGGSRRGDRNRAGRCVRGGFVGPIVFGFLATHTSFPQAWLAAASAMVLAGGVVLAGRRMPVAHTCEDRRPGVGARGVPPSADIVFESRKVSVVAAAPVIMFVRMPTVSFGDRETEWNTWYDTVHIPARARVPGIRGAHRFKGQSGGFAYVTFYEASDPGAFGGEAYRALRDHEAALPSDSWEHVTGRLPGFARSAYQHVGGDAFTGLDEVELLCAVGYDAPAGRREEFVARRAGSADPRRIPGIRREWRFALASKEQVPMSGEPAPSPEFLNLYDVQDASAVAAEESLGVPGGVEQFRMLATRCAAGAER